MTTATLRADSIREQRDSCPSLLHDSSYAYRRTGCTCPAAKAAEAARKRKYDARRTRPGITSADVLRRYHQPGVPHFFTNPARGCANVDPDIFFPHPSGLAREARAICADCPFQQECRDWAIDTSQIHGVWGGTLPSQRLPEVLRRQGVAA